MNFLEKAWYNSAPWLTVLQPVAWLFRGLTRLRRQWQTPDPDAIGQQAPVIVIGNITVGGTGKTPVIMTLVRYFQAQGLKPGVISRGYGGRAGQYPMDVDADSDPLMAGDEPVLIASACQCPVVVDPDRPRALAALTDKHDVDVVLSDDGLQHYRLPRDVEVVVIDGARLFGNGACLPAGPLREPVSRIKSVDALIINGEPARALPELATAHVMQLQPGLLCNLATGETRPFKGAPFKLGNTIQAVAGIGNPQRFFALLEQLPYPLQTFPFPDHHPLSLADLEKAGVDLSQPIVMTEKDGIKCGEFANEHFWALQVSVDLPKALLDSLLTKVRNWQEHHRSGTQP